MQFILNLNNNIVNMNAEEVISIRKELGLSQEEFGKLIGSSRNTVYNYERGEKIPDSKIQILRRIKENGLPNIVNSINDVKNIEVTYLNAETASIMYVPLVTQYAYAGYLGGYADNEFVESLPKIPFVLDKEYKGQYLCFEVKGDSMECESEESISEGSILLCRNVRQEYWKSKLHINKWDFVIVHRTEGILVKRIISHDVEKGVITIHSLNEFYEDKELHLKDISQIFNIVEVQQKRKRR